MIKRILFHLFGVALVTVLMVFAVHQLLDIYTRQDQIITVPDIKGMSQERAEQLILNAGLKYEIVDSVFRRETLPGTILEQIPKAGTSIKQGRTLFLVMQARSVQQVNVPDLTDYSYRQAESLLRSLGFTYITTEEVNSQYKDLVLSIEYNGSNLLAGARVPIDARVTIYVGNGIPHAEVDEVSEEDGVLAPEDPDESFF